MSPGLGGDSDSGASSGPASATGSDWTLSGPAPVGSPPGARRRSSASGTSGSVGLPWGTRHGCRDVLRDVWRLKGDPAPPLTCDTLGYHVGKIAAPFAGYAALHGLTQWTLGPWLMVHAPHLTPAERAFMFEKVPSTVNAIVAFFGASRALEAFRDGDIMGPYPLLADCTFSNSVGFFLYDVLVMSVQAKQHWSAWVHHLLGIAGASCMMWFRQAAFFPLAFTVPEITVVSTNALWVLEKLKPGPAPSSREALAQWAAVYEGGLWLRALLFLAYRAWSGPGCLWTALLQSQKKAHRSGLLLQAGGARPRSSSEPSLKGPLGLPSPSSSRSASHHLAALLRYWLAAWLGRLDDGARQLWADVRALPLIVSLGSAVNVSIFGALNAWWTLLVFRALQRHRAQRLVSTQVHHI